MVRKLTLATVGALALACGASSQGAVVFSETWGEETVADNLAALTSWEKTGGGDATASIQNEADKELVFAVGATNGVRTKLFHDLAGAQSFYGAVAMRDLTADAGTGGIILDSGTGNYRIQIDTGSNNLRLYKGSTQVGSTLAVAALRTGLGIGDTDPLFSVERTLKLQIDMAGTGNTVKVLIDDHEFISYPDTTAPVAFTQVRPTLYAWNGNDVAYDDIVIASVPEPTSIALVGLAVGGLFLRRRH